MASFSKLVTQAFEPFVTKEGFVWAEGAQSDRFAALVARPCRDVCHYIFVRQSPTGGVAGFVWVAPPDAPSDTLDRLYVGFRIDLGESQKDINKFIPALARRAKGILPYLGGLAEATEKELADPPVKSLRLTSYMASRAAYQAIRIFSKTPVGHYCLPAFAKAKEVVGKEADWDDLTASAIQVALLLIKDDNAPAEIRHEHFRGDSEMLGTCLVGPLYIEALVPFPDDV